jgi:hydrogenase maturation factor HypF (carbamoyltransferase family)
MNHHEAQAAMALESLAVNAQMRCEEGAVTEDYHRYFSVSESFPEENEPLHEYHVTELIREIVCRRLSGHDVSDIALFFHRAVASMLADMVLNLAKETGVKRAVLSGGCFINSILSTFVEGELKKNNIDVYTNQLVPAGDGGIALGQAYCASQTILRRGV